MHEYRNVLIRLRAGDHDREIARLGLMGRVKVAQFRQVAMAQGWLTPESEWPELALIAQHVQPP
ncbi:MAG: IS21 family transposase, partial [Betaproteobacteria bacterium]|nr:IS21 family transposase [Betaproteobacteria bacterium]